MPTATFGGKSGEQVRLEVDPNLVAVRTRSGRSFRHGPVSGPEAAALQDLDLVLDFPEVGVEVYRRPGRKARSVAQVKNALAPASDTRFVGRVLVDAQSREPVLYTENLFVKFRDQVEEEAARRVLLDAGLTVKDQLGYATNAFFVGAPEGTGQTVFTIAEQLLARDDVEYAHPELVRRLGRRAISAQQWHLAKTSIAGQVINAHANVAAAHALTLGEQITIAIIDDGVDVEHDEFASGGKIVAPRDVSNGDDDPRPRPGDHHGTACAGVACADGRVGASGVAPKARLMPIRFMSQLGSQAEANAFVWAADHGADVISCSWGPEDGAWWQPDDPRHHSRVPLPDSTRLAIDYAVSQGRGGKGCVVLFAAGNGNESVDFDGYASYAGVLAVAACNDRGRRSVYSDKGDAVFCAFPSNDFGWPDENRPEPLTPGIWTTDVSGTGGYNPDPQTGAIGGDRKGNYTNSFGGTSSACPGAAGVAALVLARNPELRSSEVKDVLRRSCDRIDAADGQWVDGHSPWYGFGRLNAENAVRLARPEPADRLVISRSFSEPVHDLGVAKVTLDVSEDRTLADLKVVVDIRHSHVGDLAVALVAPDSAAERVTLHARAGGNSHNLRRTYDALDVPELSRFVGHSALGSWTLEVADLAADDAGRIAAFGLELDFQ
jgi:subtilisin family serine protease